MKDPVDHLGDSHILGTGHMKYLCGERTVMLRLVPGGVGCFVGKCAILCSTFSPKVLVANPFLRN